MKHRLIAYLILAAAATSCTGKTDFLKGKIEGMTAEFPGEVGVALIAPDGKSFCINGGTQTGENASDNGKSYPLFSVMKFPQALAVCETLRANDIPLKRKMKVRAEELEPDTWSPMRDKFPEGDTLSLGRLLKYSLMQSDNNASNILFKKICTPEKVNKSIEETGIEGICIKYSESEIHGDPSLATENKTTPLAAAELMRAFHSERNLDEYSRYIWELMSNCETGGQRIPKYIRERTGGIAHKTGSGGVTADGKVMAVNDLGCITLNDGRHFELAVFIKDADCSPQECEELIARIAEAAVDQFSGNQKR